MAVSWEYKHVSPFLIKPHKPTTLQS